ncbi:type I-B CRISPR-associated protein Cas5b [Vallitaleaceae bacterium 9-2]
MIGLQFTLTGRTAMFKQPDVNEFVYMTYGHIHKVAVYGMLGAMLGLNGYEEHYRYNQEHKVAKEFPDFYDRLRSLEVAIEPLTSNGMFSKKMQVFNNSVGYASKEQGGNLVVREYWLEEPQWRIYLYTDDTKLMDILKAHVLHNKCTYVPYLGKNDHPATILNAKEVEFKLIEKVTLCHSLFVLDNVTFNSDRSMRGPRQALYLYKEQLPVGLTKRPNRYILKTLVATNQTISKYPAQSVFYSCEEKTIQFI